MKKILAVLAVPALAVGLGVNAQAAPSRTSGATLTVVSSSDGARVTSAAMGSTLTFKGCGYASGGSVKVVVDGPTAITSLYEVANSDGCFTTDGSFPANSAGTYNASSWAAGAKKAAASVSFTVSN